MFQDYYIRDDERKRQDRLSLRVARGQSRGAKMHRIAHVGSLRSPINPWRACAAVVGCGCLVTSHLYSLCSSVTYSKGKESQNNLRTSLKPLHGRDIPLPATIASKGPKKANVRLNCTTL